MSTVFSMLYNLYVATDVSTERTASIFSFKLQTEVLDMSSVVFPETMATTYNNTRRHNPKIEIRTSIS